jgi:acetyltransferase-like isoleucine patch superfamily enzyme
MFSKIRQVLQKCRFNKVRKSKKIRNLYYSVKNEFDLVLNKKIGKGTFIDKSVQVLRWGGVKIGENTIIGEQCWLNVNKYEKGVFPITIGNNCFIGRRNTIVSGKAIIIKDYCLTGPNTGFWGSDHVISDPMRPYVSTGSMLDKSIIIGVNVWVGANVCVLAGVNIGHGSIIGAGSVVNKDIPPFSIAVGNPANVVKRYSFLQNKWLRTIDWETENAHVEGGGYDVPQRRGLFEIVEREMSNNFYASNSGVK